ncbi:DEAD/DEAH box helicase [Secundilactobacillus paracollinoides]|uniref:DNA helicase n=1 Tax=Secundilactobacillus paracollinoides TaxID=240427 RepID=A0A1B2IYE2_9LACO|nr:DEAD/DEAH box helicase [Secundilactobacillus paracollinoides]ANZ61098.1 DNA helicase [Secundilactobacillus paracollinoides]ANZ67020.1 DNA helicase [Secundilactobacillus paracollinoides]
MSTEDEIAKAVNFGFINNQTESLEIYQPTLVTNSHENTVLDALEDELRTATSFTIAVAFVTCGGLIDLKTILADLADHNVHGRLITSTYLNFNKPEVFEDLLNIPNLDVRLLDQDGFHTKAYHFDHNDYESVIVGSANLTQNALKKNFEWNLRVTSTERGDVVCDVKDDLDALWAKSKPLTEAWVLDYQQVWRPVPRASIKPSKTNKTEDLIQPNSMQVEALKAISNLRTEKHAKRALVVAATGTGKTYLAAFDVRNVKPERMLYVVHREQILSKAMKSFKKILGGKDSDYGILSGTQKNLDCRYTFATVNMAARKDVREQFGQDAFDYILIDEAHRVSQNVEGERASMYQKLMAYFHPKFMMGMTATPERTDGTNVYAYFDYNLAYENSLIDALDNDLLAPFHYIGVTDYEKNGQTITDTTDLKHLVSDERVAHLIKKTRYYGPAPSKLHGLIFVSRIDEGQKLAIKLNQQGFNAEFVYSATPIEKREDAVERLNNGELQYILTVDIFNEGVDIPCLNQIVMMRPTQSSIIFLQQLGRGLRKYHDKDYVTVLDFIGNYNENYMIPMAFDKAHSSNKEQIRKQIISPTISGVSTINFEHIARKRILDAVGRAKLDAMSRFRDAYKSLKDKIGRRQPTLLDFAQIGSVNVSDIVRKFKTLYNMRLKFEEEPIAELTDRQYKFLLFLSREIAVSKRPIEAILLNHLIQKGSLDDRQLRSLLSTQHIFYDEETLVNVASVLNVSYFMEMNQDKYGGIPLVDHQHNTWALSTQFKNDLRYFIFSEYVKDVCDSNLCALKKASFKFDERFTIGNKYFRNDVIKLLDWPGEQNAQNVGGYAMRPDKRFFPVFIALEKTEKFQNKMAYEDAFIDRGTMRWFSKSGRSTSSNQERTVINNPSYGMIQLFVKKSDDDKKEGNDFYYLGSAKIVEADDVTRINNEHKQIKLVSFKLKLQKPVDINLYHALSKFD